MATEPATNVATTIDRHDTERWLDRYGDVLYAFALQLARDPHLAEDLVQETLLAAWSGHRSFRGESTERTWLIGILKNKSIDAIRRRRKAGEWTAGPDDDDIEARVFHANGTWRESPGAWGRDPLQQTQEQAFMTVLTECLDGIPQAQRDSFVMREIHGLDAATTGDALGVSRNNLYVLLHRARLRLRRCLEHHWFAVEKHA